MTLFTESVVEEAALAWLEHLGYQVLGGSTIAPGEAAAERNKYDDVILSGRLRDASTRPRATMGNHAGLPQRWA